MVSGFHDLEDQLNGSREVIDVGEREGVIAFPMHTDILSDLEAPTHQVL
jgi:hypothetical protein